MELCHTVSPPSVAILVVVSPRFAMDDFVHFDLDMVNHRRLDFLRSVEVSESDT